MALRGTRAADHAGSWYTADAAALSAELDAWLDEVPAELDGRRLPIPGARAVIAPHAGYRYSGPCAAWAYKALDLRRAKRVFVLGPSHTYYLRGCALTTFAQFATPLGTFDVDAAVVAALRSTGRFADIPRHNDVREHSLEMHLPYIWKALERARADGANGADGVDGAGGAAWPTLVPIMVGDGDGAAERAFAELLLPYFEDPANAFVVSSDFCHWGSNFQYWQYCPGADFAQMRSLSPRGRSRPDPREPPVHEFIRVLDEAAFRAIETGAQADFVDYLRRTENTVCGRHPISVAMAALELLAAKTRRAAGEAAPAKAAHKFAFVRYERSDLARTTSDSSVSYGAAYAVF